MSTVTSPARPGASGRTVWIALLIVYVAWGSTYVGIRIMDETVPPMIGAGLRYVAAGVAMLAFLAARRPARRPATLRMNRRELGSVALVGVLLLTGGNGFVSFAERHVPAGLAALVVASVPLWLLLLRALSGDRPGRATLAGLGVGFVGVGLLVLRGGHAQGTSVPQLLIVVGASFSWALGSWFSARLPMPDDAALGTAAEMVIGGVALSVLGPMLGEHWGTIAAHASARSLLAIAYLAVFGSIVAFTAYVWLLRSAPLSQVSTYAYVNPAVAVVLGALLLDERITGTTVIGGAIILGVVAVVIRTEARAAPGPDAPGPDGPRPDTAGPPPPEPTPPDPPPPEPTPPDPAPPDPRRPVTRSAPRRSSSGSLRPGPAPAPSHDRPAGAGRCGRRR